MNTVRWSGSSRRAFVECPRSTSAPMAQRPYIGCDRRNLGRGQLGTTLRRHRSPVLLRLRYAHGDGVRDRGETAIAPQPFATREVGPLRRAPAVCSVAARARRTRDLAVKDAA